MPNVLGPVAGGQSTARPARSNAYGTTQTWWRGCSAPNLDDGTVVDPDELNDFLAQFVTAFTNAGIVLDNADDMLWRALKSVGIRHATAGGTANALTGAFTPPVAAYAAGLYLSVKCVANNTGAATLNADGLGDKAIVRTDGTALQANDLRNSGVALLCYDGTNLQLVSFSPTASVAPSRGPDLIIADERAASTSPPAGTAFTWNTRTLNTVEYQASAGLISMASSVITFLSSGTWLARWQAHHMGADDAQTRIRNLTSGAKYYGLTVGQNSDNLASQTSGGVAVITVNANDTLVLESWITQVNPGAPWGDPTDDAGITNVYAQLELTKL